MKTSSFCLLLVLILPLPLAAQEPIDLGIVARIRNEAFRKSKVMEIAETLTDRYGFRLTGSPGVDAAAEWTRGEMASWGLQNAHLEPWGQPFGRGWQNDSVFVRMVEPETVPLYALPLAWTEGTDGLVKGEVMRAQIEEEKDFDEVRGKLAGKIVLLGKSPELKPHDASDLDRYDDAELAELATYEIPAERGGRAEQWRKRREFRRQLSAFLLEEKPLAVIEPGEGGDGGTFHVQSGGSYKADEKLGVPMVVLAPEQWARIERLLKNKEKVQVELDIRNRVLEDRKTENNVIAEIPGTDKNGGVVMMGAHLDAWHSGTGATDDAAGVAAVMEAARILNGLGVRPKRTIRVALWTGEEQGLLGSRAYVEDHFASWPEPKDPEEKDRSPWSRRNKVPPTLKPEQKRIAAYFNVDNGTGKIRGIYAQENLGVMPIFRSWLEPLHDLGATTVTPRNTGSTDHVPFDAAGIPAFQFIQDPVEYRTRTHHTNWDVYERLQREDLMQAAAVLATFVWQTANRPEMLPRKPLE